MAVDGILGISLSHKKTDLKLVIFCCYLPPEESVWGRNDTEFFGHLLSQVYLHNYADSLLVCGDINARIGSMSDCLEDTDNIDIRQYIDPIKNKHGNSFVEFLLESKMCIANGRVTPDKSNQFTSVSVKGSAVVDYIAISHEYIDKCVSCEVLSVNDLLQQYNLYGLIGDKCKPPDHSIISLTIHTLVSLSDTTEGISFEYFDKPSVSKKDIT